MAAPLERCDVAVDKKRIMIVEDDPLISRTINMCLSKRGHEVRVFSSGADMVSHLLDEKPDSILLDIGLPDCDGWFIAGLLEKFEWAKAVPVIMMSVLEPDKKKVAEFKPHAYIQKPFDMGFLIQTVEQSLGLGNPAFAF
jgi:two-component system KDP operon response regulator KdpE